jgi:hypothetical protein
MFLLITNEQYSILQSINNNHDSKKISPIKSSNNNWIVNEDLLTDCNNPGDTWHDWKEWLLSLQTTDEIPAPKPPRPSSKSNLNTEHTS